MNTVTKPTKIYPWGSVSALQEDEERYFATAIIEKSNDHLKLATVSWPKDPFDAWLARAGSQVQTAITVPSGNYTVPKKFTGSGCVEDTWTVTAGGRSVRLGHTAVWTGTEMIIWVAAAIHRAGDTIPARTHGPPTKTINAPEARSGHTAVWTGTETIIWAEYKFPF